MKPLIIFWKFTRPHTIIGSAVSVAALGYMGGGAEVFASRIFALAMVSALACNVFITGYNQVTDVATDRINKPFLPLASGEMQMSTGKRITRIAAVVALITSAWVSVWFFALIASIAVLGFLYSWREVFLKKRHLSAAAAITAVRGVLVNVGFFVLFSGAESAAGIPAEIWLLAGFVVLFSLGIAWFKDIPDIRGDAEAQIGTLAVKKGAQKTFAAGVMIVGAGYVAGTAAPLLTPLFATSPKVIAVGHLLFGIVFAAFSAKTDPRNHTEMKRFYRLFWGLFFAEYLLFAVAFAAA